MGLGKRIMKFLFDDTRFRQHEATPPLQGYGGALMGPAGSAVEEVLEDRMNPADASAEDEPEGETP
jgi:hypothetical protein